MDAKKEKMGGHSPDIDSEFIAEEFPQEEEEFVPEPEEQTDGEVSERKRGREEFFARSQLILKKAGLCALWTVIAFLLGAAELPFGAVFLGVALLCAASSKVGYIYLGLVLSSLFVEEGAAVYLSAYSATLFIRVISRILVDPPFEKNFKSTEDEPTQLSAFLPLVFSEHIWLRMATAALGAFTIGIYKLVLGGFLYYDLLGTVIALVGAPVAVYLFSGLAGNGGALGVDRSIVQAYVGEGRGFAGVISLLAALVLATDNLNIFGMSISLFLATFLTLYFCRRRGMMYGLVSSVILGLAYSPILAPAFAFAAIASGALFSVSVFFAALSASTVALAWALYIDGISALTSALPAILAASLIFAVLEKLYFSALREKDESQEKSETVEVGELLAKQKSVCAVLGEENLDALVLDDTEQRVKVMCETFSSLSSLFYSLSERMRIPASKDLRQICDNGFDSFCHGCELRSECWESEYASSLAAVGKMAEALGKNGHITTSDVSARMIERCSSIPDIITQINRNASAHTQQLIIGDKTEIFALDYELISELLAATMTSQREDFEYSASLSREVRELVAEKGYGVSGVFGFGNERNKSIFVRFKNEGEEYRGQERLKKDLEKLLSEKLSCVVSESRESPAEVIFTSAPKYRIEFAKRTVKAEGEEGFCGDTVNIFESNCDLFYSFISDGMGSGREAALTSSICSVFLSKILTATDKCDIALDMLNGFLRNKGGGSMHECSATVDLLQFDLVTGKAEFYKGGAAPSYIYRDTNLFKLRSNTVPLGIIKELDTRKISIDTAEGDLIVMVSDGVTGSKEECPWLFDLLKANAKTESLASIADMIVKRAKYEGSSDDISVVVMKVIGI